MNFLSTALLVLIPPLFFALTNIIDNKLTRFDALKKTSTLVFLCNTTNLLFSPLLLFIAPITWPSLEILPILALIGIIEMFYLFPYFKSYKYLDTSVVSALFALARILTPVFAFFLIREVLGISQYIGFFIVIIASVILSLEKGSRFKLNAGFWLMLLASTLVVFEDVVIKQASFTAHWVNIFFWSAVFAALFSFTILLKKENRADIKKALKWPLLKEYTPWFLLTEVFQFLARITFFFVIAMVPITFAEMGMSFQPFLVLASSWLMFKLFKLNIYEQKTSVARKIICFIFMAAGAMLLI